MNNPVAYPKATARERDGAYKSVALWIGLLGFVKSRRGERLLITPIQQDFQ
ncbi:hypothetical protein [Endozoicomonas acroporae]|uniref:hypothetical protein n=1 Tax=Endozoicomonas acroporae TaxID=1701104 RepID=UPI0013D00426|nr:hypothetical protein [Endozoicomonas acroporae]